MFRWSSLFRSRWAALLWSAGICWSAISFVPAAPPPEPAADNASAATDAADVKHLQDMVAQFEQQSAR